MASSNIILSILVSVILLFFVLNVQCRKHICGGGDSLEVLTELVIHSPQTDTNFVNLIHTCRKKASWVVKHAKNLLQKYKLARHIREELLLSDEVPPCLDHINTEIFSNSINTNTADLLREHYNALQTIVAVLRTIEEEEQDMAFYESLRGLRSASEILLCEVYVGSAAIRGHTLSRVIRDPIPVCPYSQRIERYARDYFLIKKVKAAAHILQQQYIGL